MTRTDRSRGLPDYVPYSLRQRDDGPAARRQQRQDRKDKFDAVTSFVTKFGGWVVSVSGARDVTIECSETSQLPAQLASRGYQLHEVDRRERLVANVKSEEIMQGKKVARTVSHPGLVAVIAYSFEL